MLSLPDLKTEYTHVVKQGEISDLHFEPEAGQHIAYVTNERLVVLDAKTGAEIAHAKPISSGAMFRKVRFVDSKTIIAGVNQPRGKGITLVKYKFTAPEVSEKSPVAENNELAILQKNLVSNTSKITALDVSRANSGYIAFARADLAITVTSLSNLRPQQTWLNVHPFAITTVAINPSGTLLASTSAGNTVTLAELPTDGIFDRRRQVVYWTTASALLLVLIAVLMQYIVKTSLLGSIEKFGLGGVAKTSSSSKAVGMPVSSADTLESVFQSSPTFTESNAEASDVPFVTPSSSGSEAAKSSETPTSSIVEIIEISAAEVVETPDPLEAVIESARSSESVSPVAAASSHADAPSDADAAEPAVTTYLETYTEVETLVKTKTRPKSEHTPDNEDL